jgi:hypothetical protein
MHVADITRSLARLLVPACLQVLVLKNAKKLQALFKCLIWAIVPSFNIGALMILHYSLFAILGMQIFGLESGPHFDEVPLLQ